jgi:UDPglucose 6-dehydrogenase
VRVQAHDPAIASLPAELAGTMVLGRSAADALRGADVAILSTEWPEFRQLSADDFVSGMRRPQLIDQNRFLSAVAADRRVSYVAVGVRPLES